MAWLRVNTLLPNHPKVGGLTAVQFRALIKASAYLAEWSGRHSIRRSVLLKATRMSSRTLDELLARGLVIETEAGFGLDGALLATEPVHQAETESRGGGWTYFIQRGQAGAVKIGSTRSDPSQRLRALQTAHDEPLRLVGVVADVQLERVLHERFAELRLHGEWFDPRVLGLLADEVLFDG